VECVAEKRWLGGRRDNPWVALRKIFKVECYVFGHDKDLLGNVFWERLESMKFLSKRFIHALDWWVTYFDIPKLTEGVRFLRMLNFGKKAA
jgi:hypothetical protein